jgi:hypothetical protein
MNLPFVAALSDLWRVNMAHNQEPEGRLLFRYWRLLALTSGMLAGRSGLFDEVNACAAPEGLFTLSSEPDIQCQRFLRSAGRLCGERGLERSRLTG